MASILIDLLLRTGSFSTDAARSAKDLEKLKKEALATGRAIGDSLKSIAAAAGLTLSVAGIAALTKSAIDAADHLNDLSKTTGIAVETLGGIGFAAKQAGGDLDSAAAAVGKLNKSIAAARAGDKEALGGFAALGLEKLIQSGAPAEQVLEAIADKFSEFADGPEKAALAIRLFGKAGADMIPLLNDGGQALRDNIAYFKRYSGVTAEVAAASDQFNDTLEKLDLLSNSFGTTLASKLLPPLQAVADGLLDAKEKSDLFDTAASAITETFKALVVLGANVAFVFKGVGREIGAIAAQMAALAQGDFDGFTAISDAVREDGERARAELDAFEKRVLGVKERTSGAFHAADNYGDNSPRKKRAPGLPSANADAELKKALDGQIKLIQEFAKEEQEAYQFAQRYVDGVFDDGLISLREKFATEKNLRDAALSSKVKALDDEIALERAASKKVTGAERIDIENRIKEATAARAEAVKQASQQDILAAAEEARQIKALRDSYDDLRASVAELKGDASGAAGIRNSKAVDSARQLITRAGGDPALADEYGDLLGKTTQLSQAQRDYNTLLEQARNSEESIALAAQESGASEIETLKAVGSERQKSLDQLGALAERARALAEALKTPEAIAFAEQLALAFRKASAEVDPLLQKVRSIGQEAGQGLGDIFGNAIQKGHGLKSVLGDIGNLISNIATKELISKPLGKAFGDLLGGTGKDGGVLGSLFGVGGGKGDAASTTASFTTLQTVGIDPTVTALVRFQNALGATSGASGGSGGSSGGGFLDSIFGAIGSFFSGGSDYSYTGDASGANFSQTGADILARHSRGGYTGSGQKNEEAGIVHKGEFVERQEVVRQPGARAFLERFNSVGMKALEGYADGGFVAGAVSRVYSRSPALAASTSGGAKTANDRPIQINQSFAPGATRETANQAAAAAGQAVRRALKRNG